MKYADELNDFPFTFAREATVEVIDVVGFLMLGVAQVN